MKRLNEAEKKEALGLLVDCVETETVNPPGNEAVLAEKIADCLAEEGLKARVEYFAPGRANAIARIEGRENAGALLLNGHLDTVPVGEAANWEGDPLCAVQRDGMLYARGSSDMKSGLCAALYALILLLREGRAPKRSVIFAATGDEERDGMGARALLESGALNDVTGIVIGEPTGGDLAIAAKGTLWLDVEIHGTSSHAAYPEQGVNAVDVAFALFTSIQSMLKGAEHPLLSPSTCTLTKISAGVTINMLPDRCNLSLDLRTLPGMSHEKLFDEIDRCVVRLCSAWRGARIQWKVVNARKAVATAVENELVRSFARAVKESTGNGAAYIGTNFFSDASIFCTKLDVPVLLYGPGEPERAHTPNECVSLKTYYEAIECYHRFLTQGELREGASTG